MGVIYHLFLHLLLISLLLHRRFHRSTLSFTLFHESGLPAAARSLPTDKLRPAYIAVNAIIYVVQLCIWIYLGINDNAAVELASKIFIVAVSFVALLGFSVYGGRLFVLLRRFPIESKGRQKKLYEVGTVTAICVTCFLIRCVVVALSAFDADVSLEVLDHPVLDFFYYMFAEILPSALVLFVLRKLPPKRVSAQYHPIN
ncbi:La-related protein 6C [Zea mays]|uniref:La-related protein 6C n=1 Tax=Zea mays TaxID=4577 RepID=A0A1D6HQP2_MAIZE|nr:La-related protein 6C [Zea mays]